MPATRLAVPIAFALAALLGACQDKRSGEPLQPADEPEAAEHPTGISASEGYQARGSAVQPSDIVDAPAAAAPQAFACEGGNRVDVGADDATVTLKDGRTIRITRDSHDALHYQGEALGFRAKDGVGQLSQDEVGTFHCTAD